MTDNGREVVIMYNSGNLLRDGPVLPGRPVQMVRSSSDNGKTWSSSFSPFPFHLGRSGEHALVLDGAGDSHGLFVQRIETLGHNGEYSVIGGLWHSVRKDGQWSNPDRLVTTYAPHDIRAVVSQGNILLAVWQQDPGLGEHGIWFSYRILDAPALPILPLSTVVVPGSTAAVGAPSPILETPTGVATAALDVSRLPQWRNSPAFPLFAGMVPVILVVMGMLIASRLINSRRD
jgi:hypothetical protein